MNAALEGFDHGLRANGDRSGARNESATVNRAGAHNGSTVASRSETRGIGDGGCAGAAVMLLEHLHTSNSQPTACSLRRT
ncbi:hypothetical protein [Halostagnicola kamekurae]|uniref:hypothetical protein n=1 Tax=Halostagnicola kamekurae TaxID=619731 RepID=UPI000B82B484|nr:hypothetical protein [Halostagnicola kamekurae]